MRKLLSIIVLSLLLSGCTKTTSEFYGNVISENKVIGMPSSNKFLAKELKKLFRKNGWKVVVMKVGSINTIGSATEIVNLETKYKSQASYVVSLSQTWHDWCIVGSDLISFDLTIINAKTGEETFVADGKNCTKIIIKDLEAQLSPFWK